MYIVSKKEENDSGIKTPKQLITVVFCAFIFPITIIMLLAQYALGRISSSNVDPALYKEL
jgi:hypothetical protein